jgi:hypothetical protein
MTRKAIAPQSGKRQVLDGVENFSLSHPRQAGAGFLGAPPTLFVGSPGLIKVTGTDITKAKT